MFDDFSSVGSSSGAVGDFVDGPEASFAQSACHLVGVAELKGRHVVQVLFRCCSGVVQVLFVDGIG